MGSFNYIFETFFIAVIVIFQYVFFYKIFNKIKNLKVLFPNENDLLLVNASYFECAKSEFESEEEGEEEEIIAIEIQELFTKESNKDKDKDKDKDKYLIACTKNIVEFKSILDSTNEYLENNKDGVVDFNIVKGISERVDQAMEKNISAMISIPLYIGLLGTIFGIIYSLFNINLETILESGSISMFLDGVKIAMFASFFGLLFTLLNSSFHLKKAMFKKDLNKAGYYSFIQANLLPKVSSDIASSVKQLQSTLNRFNINFGDNIKEFNSNTNLVSRNLNMQNQFISKIGEMGLAEIVQANLLMFDTFNNNIGTFENFLSNQSGLINQFEQFKSIIFKVEQIMQNVVASKEYFENSLQSIDKKVEVADQLYKFLQTQYSGIQYITDSTKLVLSNQDDRINELFASYQGFLKELIESNNARVENLVRESEEHIKEIVLDKEFLSMNTDIKKIATGLPEMRKKIENTANSVTNSIASIKDLKNEIKKINDKKAIRKSKGILSLKKIWSRIEIKKVFKKLYTVFFVKDKNE